MNVALELEPLIRARYPVVYVVSSEEMRVQQLVLEIARKRQKKVFEWSCNTGLIPAGASIQSQKQRQAATKDPLAALDYVIDQVEPALFLFKDFHPFLSRGNTAIIRRLKEIALKLKNSFKTILIVRRLFLNEGVVILLSLVIGQKRKGENNDYLQSGESLSLSNRKLFKLKIG